MKRAAVVSVVCCAAGTVLGVGVVWCALMYGNDTIVSL